MEWLSSAAQPEAEARLIDSGGSAILWSMDEVILAKEAMRLPPRERALLADALLVSLDDEVTKEIEAEWVAEAEDRLEAYSKGEIVANDGPAILKSIRAKYGK